MVHDLGPISVTREFDDRGERGVYTTHTERVTVASLGPYSRRVSYWSNSQAPPNILTEPWWHEQGQEPRILCACGSDAFTVVTAGSYCVLRCGACQALVDAGVVAAVLRGRYRRPWEMSDARMV
jgi:hypothetical protein